MIVSKSFKLRLYPTNAQRAMMNNNIGACRFLYNTMLREHLDAYEALKDDKQALWEYKYKTEKQYKEEYEWMKEVDSTSLQQSRIDLTRAYTNFFRSLQNKTGDSGFPKFHKKGVKDSYRVMNNNCSIKMDFDDRKIRMPKMGWIKFRDDRVFDQSLISSVTISKSSTNKYYASVLCRFEISDIKKIKYSDDLIVKGLDMSMDKFYVDNEGNYPEYYKQYRINQKRLAYLQKQVSKKVKGSANRKKAQLRVNKLYEKIANSRKDFVEKLSRKLVNKNDVIVIESLNMKAMSQCLNLGKSVNDLAWGMFVNRLEQKIAITEKLLIKADRFFASSQTCHICGYRNKSLTLKDREWDCPVCGSHLMRDENAGQNLKQYGINFLK